MPDGLDAPGRRRACFEGLQYYSAFADKQMPWLAESHQFNDKDDKLTVNTRKGVEWSDGVPFKAFGTIGSTAGPCQGTTRGHKLTIIMPYLEMSAFHEIVLRAIAFGIPVGAHGYRLTEANWLELCSCAFPFL